MSNIETAVAQSQRNIVTRSFFWWTSELAGLISISANKQRDWKILLLKTTEGLEVYRRDAGRPESIGAITPDTPNDQILVLRKLCQRYQSGPASVILRFSPNTTLQKQLTFPKATLDVIEPVLHNQMERIAPWTSEEVRFGYEVLDEEGVANDQLNVRVIVTSQTMIDEAMDLAGQIGLMPGRIDFGENAEAPSNIRLVTMEDKGLQKTQNIITLTLGILLVLSFVVCGFGISSLRSAQATLEQLNGQISITRQKAGQVQKLATENDELRRRRLKLIKRKQEETPAVVALEMLSRSLPDTAWLTGFEINKSNVKLYGLAENAASLITILENTAYFSDVKFSASTTRRPTDNKELFSISARASIASLPEGK